MSVDAQRKTRETALIGPQSKAAREKAKESVESSWTRMAPLGSVMPKLIPRALSKTVCMTIASTKVVKMLYAKSFPAIPQLAKTLVPLYMHGGLPNFAVEAALKTAIMKYAQVAVPPHVPAYWSQLHAVLSAKKDAHVTKGLSLVVANVFPWPSVDVPTMVFTTHPESSSFPMACAVSNAPARLVESLNVRPSPVDPTRSAK
ncbi:uncharacterized protein LOC115075649 [Rhinatrema bivittatum]|uniref:uncharacterized protein LOC115075649 n=1 Tax=Rhinatrema bivittatum TaxID=194408 RepID=UPI00112E9CB2|nr:uncharacterized protein LOC115075649 [Rhinatrema bivittatum]